MIRQLFFIAFLISVHCVSQTETKKVDSLTNYTARDSIRAKLLIAVGKENIYNNSKEAIKYFEAALKLSRDIGWKRGEILSLKQQGVTYYNYSDYVKAIEYFEKALRTNQDLKDLVIEAGIYNDIANIYADINLKEKALEYYTNFLKISRDYNRTSDQVTALNNIGNILSETGKTDQAIDSFKQAMLLAEELENDFFIMAINNGLGRTYQRVKNYPQAIFYFKKVKDYAEDLENKYMHALALNSLAENYLLTEDYTKAKEHSLKGLKLANELDAMEWQADSWRVLARVYDFENNYKQASMAYRNNMKLVDSIIGSGESAEVTRKEMSYKLELREAKLGLEIEHQKSMQKIYVTVAVIVICLLIMSFVLFRRKQKAQYEAKVAHTELKALRAQMNPHFIFNSLNSINSFISKNNIQEASNYLTKFAKLMRQTLENSEHATVPLEEELAAISNYMDIERKRLEDKFDYQIIIDENINKDEVLVPPAILQPFIENSIWHGVSNLDKQGEITIAVKKEEKMLACVIEDNGLGMKNNKKGEGHRSLGLKITQDRLAIINHGKIPSKKASVEFVEKRQGVRAIVKLPFELVY
jgi:tetratricopeptide (TPR) repeat protein